jgi:hypothetical protein
MQDIHKLTVGVNKRRLSESSLHCSGLQEHRNTSESTEKALEH